jgi:pyruvate dehydrogenase E2 component (dihydrolipoyllysine-residue acetyltransferase)
MPQAVIMPKLGFTQESSQIIRWLKEPGESVDAGDPIAEVTTDKVDMEIEAPAGGILDGVRYQAGETVPITQIIAYIRGPDEPPMEVRDSASPAGETAGAVETQAAAESIRATPVAANLAQQAGVDLNAVSGTGPGGRITKQDIERHLAAQLAPQAEGGKIRAVPAARRAAREIGVDLRQVKGTGPLGRVQSADVRAALPAKETQLIPPAPEMARPDEPGILRIVPLAGMRLTIAERMQKSAQEAPHITFDADIDVGALEAMRARANELLMEDHPRISLTAILVKACAWSLKRHPYLNSQLDGKQILLLKDVNIGIAVALEEGLVVPVLHSADQKGIAQIAAEVTDLAERARNGHLHPGDMIGGTFTVSNLGTFGIDRFTAIINPPESAILAVGRVVQRLVPDEQARPVVRPMMTITLSADHRVVDGAQAALYLRDLRQVLEHPELLAL